MFCKCGHNQVTHEKTAYKIELPDGSEEIVNKMSCNFARCNCEEFTPEKPVAAELKKESPKTPAKVGKK